MPYDPSEIVERYTEGAASHRNGKPLAADAAEARETIRRGGKIGSARVRDSARRQWVVAPQRDHRGRFVVVAPLHADLEPFRASADGYRPDTHLAITDAEWTLLALLAAGHDGDDGRDDEEVRTAAFRLVDRMVVDAQHAQLIGAADDEEDA
jgi:hypothetical protein